VNDEDLKRIASETKQLQGNIEQLKQKQENIVSDIKKISKSGIRDTPHMLSVALVY